MSKYVNRQKRKARSIDEVLQLIKDNKTDLVVEEYVFRFGRDYLIHEYNDFEASIFGHRYSTSHYDLVKKKLLK